MTTRPLPHARSAAGRRPAGPARVATPGVPSFQLAFPAPADHGKDHPFYELRLAANRVYQHRRAAYRAMARQLEAAEILEYVRQDVAMRMLEVEVRKLGPFEIPRYRWVDASKFRAWLPFQRREVEALYADYRRKLLGRLPDQDLGRY